MEAKEDAFQARLAAMPDIHPDTAGIYRRKVGQLAEALDHPEERNEAADAIRGLIERVTLRPGAKRGEVTATLQGEFGAILEWIAERERIESDNTPSALASGVSVSVVAGTRSHLGLLTSSNWSTLRPR